MDQFKKEYISGILVLEKGLEEYNRKNYNLDNKIKSAAVKARPVRKRKESEAHIE